MNLHEVCQLVLKDITVKKGRISTEDEFLLIIKLFPEKIRLKFPVFLGIGSTSFNEKHLKTFMLQGNGSGNALMAVSTFFQSNPEQIGQLIERCEAFFSNEAGNLRPDIFRSYCSKWQKTLKLSSGQPLSSFLSASAGRCNGCCPEYLAFMILSACSLDNDMLILQYNAYSKYLSLSEQHRKTEPLRDLLYNYCTLYNVIAEYLFLDFRILIFPRSSYSFSAVKYTISTGRFGADNGPMTFYRAPHRNSDIKNKMTADIPAMYSKDQAEMDRKLQMISEEFDITDALFYRAYPDLPADIRKIAERIFDDFTVLYDDMKKSRDHDLRIDPKLLLNLIMEMVEKYCRA